MSAGKVILLTPEQQHDLVGTYDSLLQQRIRDHLHYFSGKRSATAEFDPLASEPGTIHRNLLKGNHFTLPIIRDNDTRVAEFIWSEEQVRGIRFIKCQNIKC